MDDLDKLDREALLARLRATVCLAKAERERDEARDALAALVAGLKGPVTLVHFEELEQRCGALVKSWEAK